MRRGLTLNTFLGTIFCKTKEGTTLLLLAFSANKLYVQCCVAKALWFLFCPLAYKVEYS